MPCNYINGSCTSGCSPGWKGDTCDQSKSEIKIKSYIHKYMYLEMFVFSIFFPFAFDRNGQMYIYHTLHKLPMHTCTPHSYQDVQNILGRFTYYNVT